ncbi:class I SAM-dependent DNA methyltransferase [Hydrocarboniphaga sp.]|uniref:class I SAM-dependent DNA methyltransferase n=1 Tax=Hydrocarboniphaga sp. TaxID=2033016 RepID=UPI003D0AFD3E
MAEIKADDADAFIAKWRGVAASELSTSQSFLSDLCRLLGVDTPHPTPELDYMYERPITFAHGDGSSSPGRIDLYRRGAFVLESKKLKVAAHTKGFADLLQLARGQAESYARALPVNEGRPPFLVVVDVGNRIELYSEFSRSGATYTPFPDPRSYQIALDDLRRPEIRERLRRVWLEPLSLDPSRESARVTREIAARLATLARSLELAGHTPELVAQFLMRCLFTMFAEDVRLLPEHSFRDLMIRHADKPDIAMRMLAQLWHEMDVGGFSAVLAGDVLRFNGKLFKHPDTLPLDREQVSLLIQAAKADWKHVEPAIFGTLLERALTPGERHKLGAHYTPRAYVERLVLPTVIEPLRAEWSDAQAAALTLAAEGKQDEAIAELRRFHHRLCTVRVLDPACGSGNFLYVTLEHLKRLEGEVLNSLDAIGARQTGLALGSERFDATAAETVDPHNLLGIEINPRAAAIAEVVLWIGYLQWHFRTRGDVQPPQPVIRDFRNIENRDAVLAYDRVEHVVDERGVPVTHWDGVTMKKSPVTGEDVPDESAQIVVERYVNPRKAEWPAADFVVGNPPYIGNKRMRLLLGKGYVDALRAAWNDVADTADFVMYWWDQCALDTRTGRSKRFGLITTNSLRQLFNRQITGRHLDAKKPLSLRFVIPDHPWIDSSDGADVRVALSVGDASEQPGRLVEVLNETPGLEGEVHVTLAEKIGHIHADLTVGAKVGSSIKLKANAGICFQGMNLVGKGFRLEPSELTALGYDPTRLPDVIKPHCNARDLMQGGDPCYVIDFFGFTAEEARRQQPSLYQRLLDRVKPERDQNNDAQRRRDWWLFGRANTALRKSWADLPRMILTPETSKHRVFSFVDRPFCPDHKLYAICLSDGWFHGVLSCEIQKIWSLQAGGRLGVGNDPTWTNTTCFSTYPFPPATSEHQAVIRGIAEQLDAHRKRQQAANADLTLTGMYNVLDKLRSGETLTAKERVIHEQGLVSVLRQVHDELDAAVLDAYGWSDLLPLLQLAHASSPSPPAPLPEGEGSKAMTRDEARRAFDEAILERLVALNAERAAEEARGLVRWLRPEFQNPQHQTAHQDEMDVVTEQTDEAVDVVARPEAKPLPWPKDTIEQVRAVAEQLAASAAPLSADELAARFSSRGAWKKRLPQLLDMLVALGRAREQGGRYFGLR